MSLRQKLLLILSLLVTASVAAVAWTVLVRIRLVFEQRDQQETALFLSQFQREFQRNAADVAAAVDRLANGEHARSMAADLALTGDASPFVTEAQRMAQDTQLDFLEIVGADGMIVSSAQWPARFGYPEPACEKAARAPFLKREELPDGSSTLGIFAVRAVHASSNGVRLIGGRRLDAASLNNLALAPGMTLALYSPIVGTGQSPAPQGFDAKQLLVASGPIASADRYQPLIDSAMHSGQQNSSILYLTARREDSVYATAIPLKGDAGQVLAVLVVALPRAAMVEAQNHIRAIAYGVAGAGILLSVLFSLWIAAAISRPIEQLARAAEQVAAGDWQAQAPVRGRDELAVLARGFNHMLVELRAQRERLVQAERVAAWRELARRLAHELKNPLFPLQITVENLQRARALPEAEFDEVFSESAATLAAEIQNLKTIVGRFSDFSKMPRPQLERVDAGEIVRRVFSFYQRAASPDSTIALALDLTEEPMPLDADPELLHRAISNLVLNAMDATAESGTITLGAHPRGENIELSVADEGAGLTAEERERIFTPYYTSKQHGTGLGLAIVQSVVADHQGSIAVQSRPQGGTIFAIALPRATQ